MKEVADRLRLRACCGVQRLSGVGLLRRAGGAALCMLLAMGPAVSCSGMPVEEQARHVRANELLVHQLTSEAFLVAWGPPAYQRTEFTQFFGTEDDSLTPRSRLASGEPPRGWKGHFESGEGLFLAYPDRGWLVMFLEKRLVYREALTAEQLHVLGRSWQYEDRFRSRLEVPAAP